MKIVRTCIAIFSVLYLATFSSIAQKPLSDRYQTWQCAVVLLQSYDQNNNLKEIGTGFFINASGVLVTAAHVIDGAYRVEAVTSSGEKINARWISTPAALALGQNYDLVRLVTGSKRNCFLKLASSTTARVGETMWGIGFPGYPAETSDQVLYEGILTSRFHPPQCKNDCTFLRLQMPVTPGASGGPILNSAGEVIGVIDSVPVPQNNELKALQASELGGSGNGIHMTFNGVDPNRTMALISWVVYNFDSAGSAFAIPADHLLDSK